MLSKKLSDLSALSDLEQQTRNLKAHAYNSKPKTLRTPQYQTRGSELRKQLVSPTNSCRVSNSDFKRVSFLTETDDALPDTGTSSTQMTGVSNCTILSDIETDLINATPTVAKPDHLISGTDAESVAIKSATTLSKEERDLIETTTMAKADYATAETDTNMAPKNTLAPASQEESDSIETKPGMAKAGDSNAKTDTNMVPSATTIAGTDTEFIDTHEESTDTVPTVNALLTETDNDSIGSVSAASPSVNGAPRSKEIDAGPTPTKNRTTHQTGSTHQTGNTRHRDNDANKQVEKVKLKILTAAEVWRLTQFEFSPILTLPLCTQKIRMWLKHIGLGIFNEPFKEVRCAQILTMLSAADYVVCQGGVDGKMLGKVDKEDLEVCVGSICHRAYTCVGHTQAPCVTSATRCWHAAAARLVAQASLPRAQWWHRSELLSPGWKRFGCG